MTSMLGPLLVRAVDQAALTDALDDAGLTGTSLTVSSDLEAGAPYDDARGPVAGGCCRPATPATVPPSGSHRRSSSGPPRSSSGSGGGSVGSNAQVNALDEGCDAYVITDGACPTGKSQVMISSVDAERQQVKVRDKIRFSLARADDAIVTVVGHLRPGRLGRHRRG